MSAEIQKEMFHIYQSGNFNLGEYLYMGMGMANGHRVCISVAYKIDYCIKKAKQFVAADRNVTFTHINKIKVGELKECEKFMMEENFSLN